MDKYMDEDGDGEEDTAESKEGKDDVDVGGDDMDVEYLCAPSPDLQGASCTSGGILCGRAVGNVFNFADAEESAADQLQHAIMGRVLVYDSKSADATPAFTIKHRVTPHLNPVLTELGRKHSPIRSESYSHLLLL